MQSTVPYLTLISQQNDQTLQGSFSAVSAPIVASKYAFFRIFRYLQDAHTFAPLEIENLSKNSSNFLVFLQNFLQKSLFLNIFHRILLRFWWKFLGISRNILECIEKSLNFTFSDEFEQKIIQFWQRLDRILVSQKYEWYGPVPTVRNAALMSTSSSREIVKCSPVGSTYSTLGFFF